MNGIDLRYVADLPTWAQPIVIAVVALTPFFAIIYKSRSSTQSSGPGGHHAGMTEMAHTVARISSELNKAKSEAARSRKETQIFRQQAERICRMVLDADLEGPPESLDKLNVHCRNVLRVIERTDADSEFFNFD